MRPIRAGLVFEMHESERLPHGVADAEALGALLNRAGRLEAVALHPELSGSVTFQQHIPQVSEKGLLLAKVW